jgi:hypothetical protein
MLDQSIKALREISEVFAGYSQDVLGVHNSEQPASASNPYMRDAIADDLKRTIEKLQGVQRAAYRALTKLHYHVQACDIPASVWALMDGFSNALHETGGLEQHLRCTCGNDKGLLRCFDQDNDEWYFRCPDCGACWVRVDVQP